MGLISWLWDEPTNTTSNNIYSQQERILFNREFGELTYPLTLTTDKSLKQIIQGIPGTSRN